MMAARSTSLLARTFQKPWCRLCILEVQLAKIFSHVGVKQAMSFVAICLSRLTPPGMFGRRSMVVPSRFGT